MEKAVAGDVFGKVRNILSDALGVDEEEINLESRLSSDLGAESVDYLDISFRLKKKFGINIPLDEILPSDASDILSDTENYLEPPALMYNTYRQQKELVGGRLSSKGVALLRERYPTIEFETCRDGSLDVESLSSATRVKHLVGYVRRRLNNKG